MSARRLAALVLLGALTSMAACSQSTEDLPFEVLGRWETTEARYADRFIEIQPEIVRFGTGGTSSELYSIAHVAAEPHPRGRLFKVTYLVEGEDVMFAFHYDAAAARIRLANQPAFEWARVPKS